MIVCEVCGKSDFKNAQGLRGHKTFVHGITGSGKVPSTPLATEQRLSSLEEILDITGQDTELPLSMTLQELQFNELQTGELVEELKKLVEQQAKQIKDFDERLELVQVDRGLKEADKEHYDRSMADLESELVKLKNGVNKLVHTVNDNVEVCNDHFVKVGRLFQFLAAHIHDGDGAVVVSPKELLEAEVKLADKRAGKIRGQPETIQGKTVLPGYHYLENLNLSVREK